MFDLSRDIRPLTDLKGRTAKFVDQLKTTGQPLVPTINGRAELVVQDAESYQRLREQAERIAKIEAVREALATIRSGAGKPAKQVFDEIEAGLAEAKHRE